MLFNIYKFIINEQLKVNKIALFTFDQTWKKALWMVDEDREFYIPCLLYTSDAADERSSVDLGGRRIIKTKKNKEKEKKKKKKT